MVVSDENANNIINSTTNPGFEKMGGRKTGREIRQNRRVLSVINQSLVSAKGYPCVVKKRTLTTEKSEICEKKLVDPAHLPVTRKFSSQITTIQQPSCLEETKKLKTSVSSVNVFGDCIFVNEDEQKDSSEQPVPMSLEKIDTKISESDPMEEDEIEDMIEEPILNIDDCNKTNPLAVVDYVEDLFVHYRKIESLSCVSPNYMEQQVDINEKMRAILIDWLIEVHDKFGLRKETLFLTVNIVDRFLSKQLVVRKKLQLVGLVGMLLACKYEEVSVPIVSDLITISDKAYTRKEVIEMETLVLNTLQYNMSIPTPYVFIERFLKAAQSDKKLEMMSYYLIELALVEYEVLKFPPSLLAASAIYAAQYTLYGFRQWSKTCEWYTSYPEDQLFECSSLMTGFHQKAGTGRLTGVHRKYSSPKFGCTANHEPASSFFPSPKNQTIEKEFV